MSDPATTYEQSIEAASIALASGDHVNAERALRAAIHSVDGIDDSQLELAAALNRLGNLKQETGSHAEAEALFQRALEIGEDILGTEHLGLVIALKGLGTTRLIQGNPSAAEPLLTRALEISESHLGADHPDLVILLNDLTRLYLKQAAHGFAEPLIIRLVELKRHKGDDHPEVATVLATLASVRQALGRHESAEQLWRRVLDIRERTLAPNHFSIATALEHLAETCAARGKLGEALGLHQRALTIREATLGRDHSSLRVSRERIADLELQESEEGFDMTPPPSPKALPRRVSDATPGSALVPIKNLVPAQVRPLSNDRQVATRPLEHFVAPTAEGLSMTAVKKRAEAGDHQAVLEDIQEEMAAEGVSRVTSIGEDRAESLATRVAAFVQKRRAATIAGVAAVALPLVAWGVAGSNRSGQQKWVENPSASTQPALGPADLSIAPGDSAARAAAAKFEKGAIGDDEAPIAIPKVPAMVMKAPTVRIDSVKGLGAGFAPSTETVLRHLASSASIQRPGVVAPIGAPSRARLIGSLPTPKYPAQQLRQRTGGEVRVRFDVDSMGRPVMSTFNVVATPHAQLSTAVKNVIPTLRFEPARTPWPDSRPILETVELSFYFVVPGTPNQQ